MMALMEELPPSMVMIPPSMLVVVVPPSTLVVVVVVTVVVPPLDLELELEPLLLRFLRDSPSWHSDSIPSPFLFPSFHNPVHISPSA